MTSVPGASRYLAQTMYSQKVGSTFSAGDVLSQSGLGGDLLEAASNLKVSGIGISGNARMLNKAQLKNSSTINTMFSLTGGSSASVETAQTQIKALQSTTVLSRLNPTLRQQAIDQVENGTTASANGTVVDQEA